MRKLPESGGSIFGRAPSPELFDKGDKRRLILMSVTLVVLLVVFVVAQLQRGNADEGADARTLQATGEPDLAEEAEVVVPPFDLELLRGKVSDSRETDRVLRESGGLEELGRYVRGFGDPQFAALAVRELDAQALAELRAEPEAQRAKPYRARGTLLEVEYGQELEGRAQIDGVLELEHGGNVFFSVQQASDIPVAGDFVRIDGLFFKLFRDELESGEWSEGPLLVGNRLVPSSPQLEPYDDADFAALLAEVEDDSTSSMTGLGETAGRARWELLRYSGRPEVAAIDWEQAPELDAALLSRLVREGAQFRGQPLRIPVSRVQDARLRSAGENPLRLPRTTVGWIGNSNWTGGPGVIQFVMLPQETSFAPGAYVTARGFFLKNLAYEDRSGVLRTAPYFVLHTLEGFVIPEDTLIRNIAWMVAALTLGLALLFFVLLLRDRKKSQQFQAELVRRRRARRERPGVGGTHDEPAP